MRLTESALGMLRQKAGLTQAEAARKLGKHQTILSDWERGEYPPDSVAVERLASLYGVEWEKINEAAGKDGRRYAKRLAAMRKK